MRSMRRWLLLRPTFTSHSKHLKNKSLLEAAKIQAALNIQGEGDPLALLRIWWTKKYQKSKNSPEYKAYSLFELLTEFFEDFYTDNKSALRELELPISGLTGDPMVDKWEKEIAQGLVPDLMEDLTPEEAKEVLDWSQRVYKQKISRGEIIGPEELEAMKDLDVESFSDKY